jgi:hypothetical protein
MKKGPISPLMKIAVHPADKSTELNRHQNPFKIKLKQYAPKLLNFKLMNDLTPSLDKSNLIMANNCVVNGV